MNRPTLPLLVVAITLAMTACRPAAEPASAFAWPASLVVVGDGFPQSGDACRRIGESAATVDWLDNSASLAGCPSADAAAGVFRAQGGGRAIVIRSCQDRLPLSGGALADAARAATNAMVRSFAVDLAPHGIAVTAIAPNFFAGGWPQGRVRPFA
jgi:NAD(P)-dependent dehydrogenase (short-subunit alcohol dehydrogenase family)